MNIIQQIADVSVDFLSKEIEEIFNGQCSFSDLAADAQNFGENIALMAVEELLRRTDESIYEAAKKTKQFVVKAKGVERQILTPCGEIHFKRRYYRCKETGRYEYLLDDYLHIPKSDRIDENCKAELVNNVMDESYAKTAKRVTGGAISKQTVKNVMREVGIFPEKAAPKPKVNGDAQEIYIEADEDHVAMQDGTHAAMYKLIYVYEGKKPVCKGRWELQAKRTFGGYDAPKKLWNSVEKYITETYADDVKTTIIGDGANWIRAGLQYIPESNFALDPFHLSKYVKKICGNHPVTPFYSLLRKNDRKGAVAYAEKQAETEPWRRKAIEEGIRYIENQWDGIQRSLNDEKISSSTEAHVSHVLSDRLSSRGMGWSKEGSLLVGSARIFRENGGDVRRYSLERLHERSAECVRAMPETVNEEVTTRVEARRTAYRNERIAVRTGHLPAAAFAKYSFLRAIVNGK